MKRLKGFTLVELVITIAIVVILSVVSIPIYNGYTKRAKMAEGYALLGTIFSAQKAYFSEYGNFLNSNDSSAKSKKYTANDEVLGIDARGNKYYTAFAVGFHDRYDMKEWLRIYVIKPEELRHSEGKSTLAMDYTVTGGAKFMDEVSY